jgi:hypothetical protein
VREDGEPGIRDMSCSINMAETMKALVACAIGGLMALGAQGASAHHSYASFDMNKTMKVSGVVKEFHWTNPHSFIVLVVTDSAGRTNEEILEANGPGYLARQGWKRESIKPGDKITATVHPLRDGSPGGDLMDVTLPSGKVLSAEVVGPRPIQVQPDPTADENKNAK